MDIHQAVKAMRKATFERTPQWSLGRLIEALEAVDATDDCWVSFAFGDFVPTRCHSWRGSYSELAIGYAELEWETRPALKHFVNQLKQCVGAEFTGWKGGEFRMDLDTPVWVAEGGKSGNTGVVGIHCERGAEGTAYRVVIRTDWCEF